MGFPLRDKITGGYPIIMKFTFFVRVDFQFLLRIHFRQEANHIYSHSEWNCHSGSFQIFQSDKRHQCKMLHVVWTICLEKSQWGLSDKEQYIQSLFLAAKLGCKYQVLLPNESCRGSVSRTIHLPNLLSRVMLSIGDLYK